MLSTCKKALRISTTAYDDEITLLIESAQKDLSMIGVCEWEEESLPPLVKLAIITYVKLNFGSPDDHDKLKVSYDEQKAQLQMSHLYNNRGWTE